MGECADCGAGEGQEHKPDCKQMERIRKGFGAVSRVKTTKSPGRPRKKKAAPIENNTMWMQAFFEIAAKAQQAGETSVEFSEVDDLVVEWSKQPLKDLMEALS